MIRPHVISFLLNLLDRTVTLHSVSTLVIENLTFRERERLLIILLVVVSTVDRILIAYSFDPRTSGSRVNSDRS